MVAAGARRKAYWTAKKQPQTDRPLGEQGRSHGGAFCR
jgi:hypothetical protein